MFLDDENFEIKLNSGFKKEQSSNCDQGLIETNAISVSSSDLLSLVNVTEHSEPSSKVLSGSVSLSEFPDPLSLSCSLVLSSSLNENLNNIEPIKEKEHSLDLYNKTDLNDFCVRMIKSKENLKINQDIKVLPTEECDHIEDLCGTQKLQNSYKDSQTKQFESFIKSLDFIDPDILYNIRLKEHTEKMAFLVKKILNHTNDNQIWEECKKLKPQIECDIQFIGEDRLNFFKSICKWKYDIDTADQDKIMEELAADFSDHAETKVVNEENKSGLADVSIQCIKDLAFIKNNIDIQLRSSSNPIDNNLRKEMIKREIRDLIIHYENYIFNIRNKLKKKYDYLQKIIDKYVKHMSIKVNDINTVKENTKNNSVSYSNSNIDLPLNNENVETLRNRLYLPIIEDADNSVKIYKFIKDFDADFKNCSSSSIIKNNILFNSTVLNNPNGDYANSNSTPDQTEHENVIKEKEYSIEDDSDMAFAINNDDTHDLNILFVGIHEDLIY